jgi:hypothetical protein
LRINHRRFGLEGLIVTRDSQRYGGLGRKRADGIDIAALLGEIRGPARNLCIPLSVDGFGSGGKRKTGKSAPLYCRCRGLRLGSFLRLFHVLTSTHDVSGERKWHLASHSASTAPNTSKIKTAEPKANFIFRKKRMFFIAQQTTNGSIYAGAQPCRLGR